LIGNVLVTKIKSDDLETLYIGTNGQGLFVANLRTNEINNLQKNENDQASLSSSSIYSLFLDESKRLWVGTYSGGLNYSNYVTEGFHLHSITTNSQLANKSIRSFYFAPDGNQFFGTRSGFIHRNNNGDIYVFTIDNFSHSSLSEQNINWDLWRRIKHL
jgi:ligand-binding sensor domain-containing protein